MLLKIRKQSKLHVWFVEMAAADPGFVRFHFAIKIVISILFACLVMFGLLHINRQTNLTPIMLTGLVTLQASVLVNDSTEQARKVTTILFPVSSALSITIATTAMLLGNHLADFILVFITFFTFYLQKFGRRYFTLGMIGFLSYYFSLMYMQNVTFSQIFWYYIGILVATALAYLVNFILLKERTFNQFIQGLKFLRLQERPNRDTINPQPKKIDLEEKKTVMTMSPSTIKGLQTAVASGLAIVIVNVILPSHQYWIVLVVNMIILGTETTGRTVAKASERVIGTILGAMVSVVVIQLVKSHPYAIGLFLIITIFLAYYFLASSYTVFMFWITMMLTMAFGLQQVPAIEYILILRVVDTMVGVLLGVLAAMFIMPQRTTVKIQNLVNGYLKDIKTFIDTYSNDSMHEQDTTIFANLFFHLDQKLRIIKSETKVLERWKRVKSIANIHKNLIVLSVFHDYAKYLASSTNQRLKLDLNIVSAVEALEKNVEENLESVCQRLNIGVTVKRITNSGKAESSR